MKKIIYIIIIALAAYACNNSGSKRFLPNCSGKAGELVIVIDNKFWESNVGDTLKYTLAQSQIALPQPEPLFTLINVPPAGFSNIFRIHRNIIRVNISSSIKEPSIQIEEGKWANFQLIIDINAPDKESFIELFNDNKIKIITKILNTERDRTVRTHKKLEEREIREQIMREHKVSMVFPQGFRIDVDSASFVWISHTEPDVDQGVLIYYYPYYEESDLSKESLIKKRNEVLKKHVPGSSPGSYMTTEDLVPVYYNSYYKDNGLYIAELRGLWKLEKGFMGGPFVSNTTVDTVYNRIVTVEGYIFAPNREKRNLVRQVEAIINTLQITK